MKRGSACLIPVLAMSACVVDEVGSIDKAAGSGPIDQQQPNHPFVSGGYTCAEGGTGGMAQGVTPGASSWEVVSLYLFITEGTPADQPVTVEIRDGAATGPALASASGMVSDREGDWIDFTFAPPVALTPGSPVFIHAAVDDRVAWHTDRTVDDPYPGGPLVAMCGGVTFELPGDFAFITYAPAVIEPDSDGDGLPDAEAAILAGDTEEARDILTQLRRHLDGCESGPAADRNDWITDCPDQDAIRDLIDGILAAL